MFGLSELAVILIVVIAVLAAKKLPELARSAGKSARILKAEARAAKDDEKEEGPETGSAPRVIQGETVTPVTTAPTTPATPAAPVTESRRPDEGRGAGPRVS